MVGRSIPLRTFSKHSHAQTPTYTSIRYIPTHPTTTKQTPSSHVGDPRIAYCRSTTCNKPKEKEHKRKEQSININNINNKKRTTRSRWKRTSGESELKRLFSPAFVCQSLFNGHPTSFRDWHNDRSNPF